MALSNNFIFISLEKLLVVLRDGRTLIGYLRTIDQFGMYPNYFYEFFANYFIIVKYVTNIMQNTKIACCLHHFKKYGSVSKDLVVIITESLDCVKK